MIATDNKNVTVTRFLRETKMTFLTMQDQGNQMRKIKEERTKNQIQLVQKSLGQQGIPTLEDEGDVLSWLIHIKEKYRNADVNKQDLAAALTNSIKNMEIKSAILPISEDPSKIFNKIMADKIFQGGAVKAYFVKKLLRRNLTKVTDSETNPSKRMKSRRAARLEGINVAISLKKLNQESAIRKDLWDRFNQDYCVDKDEAKDWNRILALYQRGNRERRIEILRQMKSLISTAAIGLTDETGNANVDNGSTSILDIESIDTAREEIKEEVGYDFNIIPSLPALSDKEFMVTLVVYWEHLNFNYKEGNQENFIKTRRNLYQPERVIKEDETKNDEDETAITPGAANRATILVNLGVMPPNFEKPPVPVPGPKAMANYPQIPCELGCGKVHPNQTLWYCGPKFQQYDYDRKLKIQQDCGACRRCLGFHADGEVCKSTIVCSDCKGGGTPADHNIALCPFSRYRFGCDMNKKQKQKKFEKQHQTKINICDSRPSTTVIMKQEDLEENDEETETSQVMMMKAEDNTTNDDNEEEDDTGIFTGVDFSRQSDLIAQIICKARSLRKGLGVFSSEL